MYINDKIVVLITPYMYNLMENHTPFLLFYDNGQLLEGDEVADYERNKSCYPPHKGELEGAWDEEREYYCIREIDVFEAVIPLEYLAERNIEGLYRYLKGMDVLMYEEYEDFRQVYKRGESKMKNPVTIGLWDENYLLCVITVEKENVEKAFKCINEGWDMWYSGTTEEDGCYVYPENWNKEDWEGGILFNCGFNEPVYYLLEKRNIEYIEEVEMMCALEDSEDGTIFDDKITWGESW